jgi:hypothetical protein
MSEELLISSIIIIMIRFYTIQARIMLYKKRKGTLLENGMKTFAKLLFCCASFVNWSDRSIGPYFADSTSIWASLPIGNQLIYGN